MSGLLQGAVYCIELPGPEQRVMVALADHGKDDGTDIYPGVRNIAWKLTMSERQVQRILRSLEQKQLLIPVGNVKGGRRRPTRYEMHLENGTKKPPFVRDDGNVVTPPEAVMNLLTKTKSDASAPATDWTEAELERVATLIVGQLKLPPAKLAPLRVFLRQQPYAPAYLIGQAVICAEWHSSKGRKIDIRMFGRWLQDDADHRAQRQQQQQQLETAESEQKPDDGQPQSSAISPQHRDELTPEAATLLANINERITALSRKPSQQ